MAVFFGRPRLFEPGADEAPAAPFDIALFVGVAVYWWNTCG